MPLFSHRQCEYRIRGEKQYRRTKPSPRGEGGERSEPDRVLAVRKRAGKIVSSTPFTRAPYPPLRGPPSPMGKATIRGYRYPRHNAFPNGECKEEAAWPQKRKPTPPRCARQPLLREGALVDTPSFLWKEVPRRGGGWMGIAVFPKQSLPRVGKVASGASRIGY